MNKSIDTAVRGADAVYNLGQPFEPSQSARKSKKLNYIIAGAIALTIIVAAVLIISLSTSAKNGDSYQQLDEEVTTQSSTSRPTRPVEPAKPIDPGKPIRGTTSTSKPNRPVNLAEPVGPTSNSRPVKPSNPSTTYALEEFAANLDTSVDPCDDFYQYACGSFSKRYPLLNNQSEVNYYTIHDQQVYRKVVDLLEGKEPLTHPLEPLVYAKRVWHSCVHDNSQTADQMNKLTKYLQQLDNLDSWKPKFVNLTKDGYNVLLTVEQSIISTEVSLAPPELEFEKAHSTEESSPLLEYYSSLIKLYKGDIKEEDAVKLAREIIEFEYWMITNTSTTAEKAQDPKNKLTFSELDEMTQMEWTEKLLAIIMHATKFREFTKAVIEDFKYLRNFRKMMDSKDEAFLSEYLKLAVVRQSCFFLGQECRDLHFKMASSVHKFESKQMYEERTCYNTLDKYLQEVLFKVYDPKFHSMDTYYARALTKNVADTMDSFVGKLTWMDAETKEDVFERIRQRTSILYKSDPELESKDDFEIKHSSITYETGKMDIYDYFTGLIAFKRENLLKDWHLSLFATHPLWSNEEEELYVPDFFTKGLFFSKDLPDPIKFGFYGSLLAHEMTHQFDASAANFSKMWATDLWTKDTRSKFDQNMHCLIDAYDGKEVGSGKINGTSTLDENLADFVGLRVAYLSFRNNTQPDYKLPYLPDRMKGMTDLQLFFLSYANSHCSNDVKQVPVELELGIRSPRKHRVNLPLAHNKIFSAVFSCQPSSKMNPERRCFFR